MTVYPLFIESGPKKMKTMVHVLDLLGCVVTGPTTDAALERTPEVIRAFLRLLGRHGEAVDPEAPFTTEIADHITEGDWLGNGSPYITFPPDLQPLTEAELDRFLPWLEWMQEEMLALVTPLSDAEWTDKPASGRPIRRIIEHVAGAEYNYVRIFGKIPGLSGPGNLEKLSRDELLVQVDQLRTHELARLRSLTDEERSATIVRGSSTRTARQILRRMLEHQWEHLAELTDRLDAAT